MPAVDDDVVVVMLAHGDMEVVVVLLVEIEYGVVASVREDLGPEELEVVGGNWVLVESDDGIILLV